MCRKLPAELRDLVYRFLCIEDQLIAVGPCYPVRNGSSSNELAIGLSRGRILIDHSERLDPAIVMPHSHIFSQAYMGQAVASETRMVYLANNTFSLCNVGNGVARFLAQHHPNVGFVDSNFHLAQVTPFHYVRKLQIRIRYEVRHELLMSELMGDLPVYFREIFASECDFLRRSNTALHTLLVLPQGTQPLELEFIIMTSFDEVGLIMDGGDMFGTSRKFINLLQSLRNTFYTLKYDRENTEIKIIHHDEVISPFPRDITLLWSLSKEQWEYVRNDLVPFLEILGTPSEEPLVLQIMYTTPWLF
jgi:hypothetical protein